jgi:hypothetical protein
VGADEVAPECWLGNATLRAWAAARLAPRLPTQRAAKGSDRAAYLAMLSYFLHRVTGPLAAAGKKVVMWEDSFTALEGLSGARRGEDSLTALEGPPGARRGKLETWSGGGGGGGGGGAQQRGQGVGAAPIAGGRLAE